VAILRGLERDNFGLDHILVCPGVVSNTVESKEDLSVIPPRTILVGRLEISAEEGDDRSTCLTIEQNSKF
jgi:hypothetical protein